MKHTAAGLNWTPVPTGAIVTEWETDGGIQSRIVYTPDRCIEDGSIEVHVSAIQHTDGHFDMTSDPPVVFLDSGPDRTLTTAEARMVANLLTQAADQLDGWIHEFGGQSDNRPA